MTRVLIELAGQLLLDADSIKLVHLRRNATPFRCHETGKQHFAHIAIETWHDVYKVPFATIAEARAAFADVVNGIKMHRQSIAATGALRTTARAPSGLTHDARGGRLDEGESPRAIVQEAAE